MPDELVEETTRAFVDYYDEMLDSQGISRLTQEQREVLRGFLYAAAAGEPSLAQALQETRKSWQWLSDKMQSRAYTAK